MAIGVGAMMSFIVLSLAKIHGDSFIYFQSRLQSRVFKGRTSNLTPRPGHSIQQHSIKLHKGWVPPK